MAPHTARFWALIPAAGIGHRMGGEIPKQYLRLAGFPLLLHALAVFLAHPQVQGVVVALAATDHDWDDAYLGTRLYRCEGGSERADSVRSGLETIQALGGGDDWVMVHDAARPCVLPADINAIIATVGEFDGGCVLAEPSTDTLKQVDENLSVEQTLSRQRIWRAQTPQCFKVPQLSTALQRAGELDIVATDESHAIELAGGSVRLVRGSRHNLKLTTAADWPVLQATLMAQLEAGIRPHPGQFFQRPD